MRPAPRSTISGAPWRLVMMWLWTARSSSFCPWVTETAQKGEPHSVSASPPQMSLTSTSSRPSSARTRSNSRSTSDSTVWSVRTAMPRPPSAVTISAVSSIVSGRPSVAGRPRTLRPVQ